MNTAGRELPRESRRKGLELTKTGQKKKKPNTAERPSRRHRKFFRNRENENDYRLQSRLLTARLTLRRLPLCTALAATVTQLIHYALPSPVRWTVRAWSAGLMGLAAAVIWSALSRRHSRWAVSEDRFELCSGLLSRRELSLRRDRIVSVQQIHTPLTAIFRASWVHIHISSPRENSSCRLLLSRRQAEMLTGQLLPLQSGRRHSYHASGGSLWLAAVGGEGLAAFISAAFSFYSAARDTVARHAGRELTRLLHARGAVWLTAAAVGAIWLAKIVHTRITHAGMSLCRMGDTLMISRGVISRRTERIARRQVCGLDMRISLPGLLWARQSCSLLLPDGSAVHYLPPVDRRRLAIETAVVSPHSVHVCTVRPEGGSLRYAAGRWAQCLLFLPLISILRRVFPFWSSAIYVIGLAAALLLVWRALVTTICAGRAQLKIFADCAELTGTGGLAIRTLRVFRPSVGMIRITQSPISRMTGKCSVRLIPRGGASSLRCIGLPLGRTTAACERMM